jgi:hypothetical protein
MKPGNDNRVHEPFLLLFTTLVVLTAFSFVRTEFNIGTFSSKPVHFLSDVVTTNETQNVPLIRPVLGGQKKKVQNEFVDGPREKYQITEFMNGSAVTQYAEDSLGGLVHFLMALDQLKSHKKKTVRIAYFGDSMIEGDLITQDLRKMLQDTFGGYGVGYMPVTSIVAGFRISITHSFSKNWQDFNLNEKITHPVGLSGHTFIPAYTGGPVDSASAVQGGGSWVKFSAVKTPRLDAFYNVRMFYGPAQGSHFVNANGKTFPLEGKQPVNMVTLNHDNPVKTLSASFTSSGPIDIYGFSIDSDSGIFVDNFSLRGNCGLPLVSIPSAILSGIDQYLGYDLVIFQYGANVASSKTRNYDWYEKGMVNVVNHFKQSFPGASIMVVSTGDKGYRKDGKLTTDPTIPFLVQAQRNVAEKTGSAFWSLYDAMGGYESMVSKWTGGDTVYANKDYTHFNFRGAKRVGNMLFNVLMSEYKMYKKSAKE